MRAEIYWIREVTRGRLGIMARPRAGEWLRDEISGWRAEGVNAVVCLLETSEVRELELGDERSLCSESTMEFLSLPIPDRGVPASVPSVTDLVARVLHLLNEGASVAVHCRAGIGRSALIAACILCRLGFDAETIFPMISRARGVSVPDTEAQVKWLKNFARSSA
jgi:protein-tyrosine phosphatase